MKKLIKSKLLLQVIVTTMVTTLAAVGIVMASTTIGTSINTTGTLDVTGASTLTGNTAVTGTLTVTGATYLSTASSTGIVNFAQIRSTTGAISFDNENLSTTGTLAAATTTIALGDFTVGTTDFYVDDDNARVGIGSSSPSAKLSVGVTGSATSATSTIDFAKPCFRMMTDAGVALYYWPSNVGVLGGWATSTATCF